MKRLRMYVSILVLGVGVEVLLVHAGRDLEAARSVGGAWTVRVERIAGNPSCAALRAGSAQQMSIVQSGPDLQIRMSALALDGRIEGRDLRAAGRGRLCSSPVTLSLLLDERTPSAMRGSVELPFAQPPTRAWLTATRIPTEERK
jgi:hypothetical protein